MIQTTTNEDIQYHILKTEHKDFVTGYCTFPMGKLYADYEARHIPSLLASMMKLGTTSKSEEVLNEILESKGIQLWIAASDYSLKVGFICLTKHLDETISLIAEQLSLPLFDQDSFDNLKKRLLAQYNSLKDNTGYRAYAALTQAMFPKEHIMCVDDPQVLIELTESTKLDAIKQYHKDNMDFSKATWVLVGDVPKDAKDICEKHMPKDKTSNKIKRVSDKVELQPSEKNILIKDKTSVDYITGHVFDIDRKHPDYLPLMLAIDALGGSFSARLMRTVRDQEGLTYNVRSSFASGINGSQCYWMVSGSFGPALLDKGIKSIQRQLDLWVDKGLTEAELSERKEGLLGKYKVGISDANSISEKITNNIEQGFDANYLYTFCEEVEKVNINDVNRVIKEYIKLDQLIRVTAGSVE